MPWIMKLVSVLVCLAPLLTYSNALPKPVDCSDLMEQEKHTHSGVHTIYPFGERFGVEAYCDLNTDGGRWTVIQRRMDGTMNFYRPWSQYKTGFGDPYGEYWLGLEFIHMMSSRTETELLVEMEDFEGKNASARYSSFSVGPECDGYRLKVTGFTNGGAGDSLSYHNDMKFSTFDKEHSNICTKTYLGAFWYNACHYTNPNGVYRWGADKTIFAVGIDWKDWKGYDYSLKAISMKIRPVK